MIQNCTHKFHEIASDPRFKFFGNVDVLPPADREWPLTWTSAVPKLLANLKSGISLIERHRLLHPNPPHALPLDMDSLFRSYTHLLIASGAPIPTLHPALPPVPGKIIPALDMVHWYTGHPNSMSADSSSPSTDSVSSKIPSPLPEHVTVVGNGNVALDVARILLSDPSRLTPYGLPAPVMRALADSKVKHVSIVGRRGPREASFTAKELRELMNLEGVAFTGVDAQVMAGAFDESGGRKLERQKKRLLDILKKGSALKVGDEGVKRTWSLDFWRSPAAVVAADSAPLSETSSESDSPMLLTLNHTALADTGRLTDTGETTTLRTSLIVTALGHRCAPETTPFCDPALGHIRTVGGSFTHPELQTAPRATGQDAADATAAPSTATDETSTTSPLASRDAAETAGEQETRTRKRPPVYGQVVHPVVGKVMPNVYAAGWAARGAKGVLGTTMLDAHAVGEAIVEEWLSGAEGADARAGALADVYALEGGGEAGELKLDSLPADVQKGLEHGVGRNVVSYEDWLEIDREEVERGKAVGEERVRLTWQDVKQILRR